MWPRIVAVLLIVAAAVGLGYIFIAPRLSPEPALALPTVDRIVVEKAGRRMLLYSSGKLARTIEGIQLGDEPVGPKHFEGDERTPEGTFTIDSRNPRSAFHLSLHISYPRQEDIVFAKTQGRGPGGQVFIHGQPNWLGAGRLRGDWTNGCIAVSNAEINGLWRAVANGTSIEIRP